MRSLALAFRRIPPCLRSSEVGSRRNRAWIDFATSETCLLDAHATLAEVTLSDESRLPIGSLGGEGF